MLNQERGAQSTGVFNSEANYFKDAVSAQAYLRDEKSLKFMQESLTSRTWAMCGHTRAACRGSVCPKNAHPFRYKTPIEGHYVVGSHNGVVTAPKEYEVDSQYIIHLLSQAAPGDYQAALGEVSGWYALSWRDTRTPYLYLLNWSGNLSFNHLGQTVYYSSDKDHLHTATQKPAEEILGHGEVWRFTRTTAERMPDFTGKTWAQAREEWARGTSHYGSKESEGLKEDDALPLAAMVEKELVRLYVCEHDGELWYECKDGAWRHESDKEVLAAVAKAKKNAEDSSIESLKLCGQVAGHLLGSDKPDFEKTLGAAAGNKNDDDTEIITGELLESSLDQIIQEEHKNSMDEELDDVNAFRYANDLRRAGKNDEEIDKMVAKMFPERACK